MTKEHRQAADQALVMDAPRIIRKDMTLLTELVAKYQGLEGALNGVGQEEAAEEVSDLVVPLVNARAALEHVIHKLGEMKKPTGLPGVGVPEEDLVDADTQAKAQAAAFDLEDAIMNFIEEHKKLPTAVLVRPDIHEMLMAVWPGRTDLKLRGGSIALEKGGAEQGDAPFAFRAA